MKKLKRFIFSLFIFSILILPKNTFAKDNILIWINGDYVITDAQPVIEGNRTLVPIRVISENLGYKVTWDEKQREVNIVNTKEFTQNINLKIDNNIVSISDDLKSDENQYVKKISLDVAPKIIKNRTFVPIRTIAELFSNTVNWDNVNRTVVIGEGYVPKMPESIQNNLKQDEKIITTTSSKTYISDISNGHIKGNKNSLIYHLPNGKSYNKISPKNIVFFDSEEDAQNAGYRKAKD